MTAPQTPGGLVRCTLPQEAQDGFARWLEGVMQAEHGHLGKVEVRLRPWTWASFEAVERERGRS